MKNQGWCDRCGVETVYEQLNFYGNIDIVAWQKNFWFKKETEELVKKELPNGSYTLCVGCMAEFISMFNDFLEEGDK